MDGMYLLNFLLLFIEKVLRNCMNAVQNFEYRLIKHFVVTHQSESENTKIYRV